MSDQGGGGGSAKKWRKVIGGRGGQPYLVRSKWRHFWTALYDTASSHGFDCITFSCFMSIFYVSIFIDVHFAIKTIHQTAIWSNGKTVMLPAILLKMFSTYQVCSRLALMVLRIRQCRRMTLSSGMGVTRRFQPWFQASTKSCPSTGCTPQYLRHLKK